MSPDARLGLVPQTWRAFEFYRRCKAKGEFPDDPIVEFLRVEIELAIEDAQKEKEWLDERRDKIRFDHLMEILAIRAGMPPI